MVNQSSFLPLAVVGMTVFTVLVPTDTIGRVIRTATTARTAFSSILAIGFVASATAAAVAMVSLCVLFARSQNFSASLEQIINSTKSETIMVGGFGFFCPNWTTFYLAYNKCKVVNISIRGPQHIIMTGSIYKL